MQAIVLLGNSQAELRDLPRPVVKPGWVLVRIKAAGICGSDLHFYHSTPEELDDRVGRAVGHEPAGVVEKVGEGVTAVRPGDRVSVYHWIGCGHCPSCLAGLRQHCPEGVGIAAAGYGSCAEYVLAPEANCLPLPNDLSFATGAMMACCAATAYHALGKLGASGRDDLVIYGLGPVGLCALLEARAMGTRVIGVEIVPERIALAQDLGAETIDGSALDAPAAVRALTGGRGAGIGLETSGSSAGRRQIVESINAFGKAAYVGLGGTAPVVDPSLLIETEKTLMGSYVMPMGMYDSLTRFLIDRHVDLDRIITHRFPIERGVDAFALFDSRRTGKVILEFD